MSKYLLSSSFLARLVLATAIASNVLAADSDVNSLETLKATQQRFREAAAKVRPSLVRIETVGGTQPVARSQTPDPEPTDNDPEGPPAPRRTQKPFQETLGSGFVIADGPTTGFVYSTDGYIVTSSFNFVRDPALISVTLADGRMVAADLVARDQVRKIALLKVDATDLQVPQWASLEEVRVGQWAIALGLGLGGTEPSMSVGVISAKNRMHKNAIQTDAKLSPINFGGPLCDIQGRVVGVTVPMAQRPGELAGVEMYDSGVGFAVPKHRLDAIVGELKTGRSFLRGWLGVSLNPRVTDAVVVQNIADPSPSRDAGVQIGDKIVKADGSPVKHFGQLMQALYMIPAGESVEIEVEREGQSIPIKVVLAESAKLGPLPDLPEPFDPAAPQESPADPPPSEEPPQDEP
jgi:serine protease Do